MRRAVYELQRPRLSRLNSPSCPVISVLSAFKYLNRFTLFFCQRSFGGWWGHLILSASWVLFSNCLSGVNIQNSYDLIPSIWCAVWIVKDRFIHILKTHQLLIILFMGTFLYYINKEHRKKNGWSNSISMWKWFCSQHLMSDSLINIKRCFSVYWLQQ